ncbi:MAG: SDR family oxidoreductase [Candidatus Krumholzibacteria bacterium]|nr:SDR family oxidoreductase [Candidatus Krumholzibacteria bacterium]MDP6668680.1 SDR family oxidoreductase [Candidatus Krumholzibacteria bacterium]MDP6797891.1 SDR family oxidoreductase [Candidatus Krumholzibacteria bacterium]MDP7021773.1 SDR family oxidoreductase [Candidatus Krumholzibacteria bacterium]
MKGFFEDGSFDGYSVLVTGGGTGLGLETSRLFARLGAKVAIVSRSEEHHSDFLGEAEREGWTAAAHVMDVREPDRVNEVFAAVAADFGGLDILVNNAAGNFIRPSMDLPPKGWKAVIDIALSGVFYCSQAAGRIMREQDRMSSIVNIIAPYAETGAPGVVHSVTAKAGVLAMTKTLGAEWAGYGIRVNAVSPGAFESEGAGSRLWPSEEIHEAIRRQVPMKRFASAEEIARAVVMVASPQADYMTGASLTIDGGMWLGRGLHGDLDPSKLKRKA